MLYSFEANRIEKPALTPAPEGPSDEALMAEVKKGNEAALATLHRRHLGLLRTVGARVLGNECDVDDLVQEAFVQIWNQAEHYREENGKALGWIVTLTRRRAIDKLRKKQAYQRASDRLRGEVLHEGTPGEAHTTDDVSVDADRAEIFARVLSGLPDAQREAVTLAFYRGMSQREIASHTGVPLGTIKTRLDLALRKVKNAIMALGGAREWSTAQG